VLARRFTFASLVAASFALMLMGKADTIVAQRVRAVFDDAIAPILDVLSRPAAAAARIMDSAHELINIRADNARLRDENERLMHWQVIAQQLDQENRALHAELNFIPGPDPAYVTTRVIGDSEGPFVHSILLAAGSRDGLQKGDVVLSGEFLVGRVTEVGQRSARALLLTDINSAVPVMLDSSRLKAILAGDNTERPVLQFLAPGTPISPGDRVSTSGDGGVFPPGIPVGTISSTQDGSARVVPFVRRHQLDYVTVVDYGLPGLLSLGATGDQ
jgi:rod shape-determining protein MreC